MVNKEDDVPADLLSRAAAVIVDMIGLCHFTFDRFDCSLANDIVSLGILLLLLAVMKIRGVEDGGTSDFTSKIKTPRNIR